MRFPPANVIPSTAAEITAAGWAAFRHAQQSPWTPESSRAQTCLWMHLEICSRALDAGAGITPERLQQVKDATDQLLQLIPDGRAAA